MVSSADYCNVEWYEREECGQDLGRDECELRGCCYNEHFFSFAHSCYCPAHTTTATTTPPPACSLLLTDIGEVGNPSYCNAQPNLRSKCGSDMNEADCTNYGCCWDASAVTDKCYCPQQPAAGTPTASVQFMGRSSTFGITYFRYRLDCDAGPSVDSWDMVVDSSLSLYPWGFSTDQWQLVDNPQDGTGNTKLLRSAAQVSCPGSRIYRATLTGNVFDCPGYGSIRFDDSSGENVPTTVPCGPDRRLRSQDEPQNWLDTSAAGAQQEVDPQKSARSLAGAEAESALASQAIVAGHDIQFEAFGAESSFCDKLHGLVQKASQASARFANEFTQLSSQHSSSPGRAKSTAIAADAMTSIFKALIDSWSRSGSTCANGISNITFALVVSTKDWIKVLDDLNSNVDAMATVTTSREQAHAFAHAATLLGTMAGHDAGSSLECNQVSHIQGILSEVVVHIRTAAVHWAAHFRDTPQIPHAQQASSMNAWAAAFQAFSTTTKEMVQVWATACNATDSSLLFDAEAMDLFASAVNNTEEGSAATVWARVFGGFPEKWTTNSQEVQRARQALLEDSRRSIAEPPQTHI